MRNGILASDIHRASDRELMDMVERHGIDLRDYLIE